MQTADQTADTFKLAFYGENSEESLAKPNYNVSPSPIPSARIGHAVSGRRKREEVWDFAPKRSRTAEAH